MLDPMVAEVVIQEIVLMNPIDADHVQDLDLASMIVVASVSVLLLLLVPTMIVIDEMIMIVVLVHPYMIIVTGIVIFTVVDLVSMMIIAAVRALHLAHLLWRLLELQLQLLLMIAEIDVRPVVHQDQDHRAEIEIVHQDQIHEIVTTDDREANQVLMLHHQQAGLLIHLYTIMTQRSESTMSKKREK